MKIVKILFYVGAFLCFLCVIWSKEPVKYFVSGLYLVAVAKYLMGNEFNGRVKIGDELIRDKATIGNVLGLKGRI